MEMMRPHPFALAPHTSTAEQAHEVRFRIGAANSTPRRVRIVALDDHDEEIRTVIGAYGQNVKLSSAAELTALLGTTSMQDSDWPRAMNAASGAISTWLDAPDLVIIVGREGDEALIAALAAQTWNRRGVTVSAVLRPAPAHPAGALSAPRLRTADLLRPWCTMLVHADSHEYLGDLLNALGAS
jgi:hypothetical protein